MKSIIREETWPVIDQFFQEMPEARGKLPSFQEAMAQPIKSVLLRAIQTSLPPATGWFTRRVDC